MTPYIAIVDDQLDGPAVKWYRRDYFKPRTEPSPKWMELVKCTTYLPTGEFIERADGAQAEVYRREEDL